VRRSGKISLVAVVAALLGTVTLVSSASAASGPSRKTIHVIQSESAVFTNVDVGPTGDSPGDYVVITGALLKPATNTEVGSVVAVCTLVKVTPTFPSQCVATASLSEGDIAAQGIFESVTGKANVLAVTGGTGAYRAARGTATGTILENGATDIIFRLIL
jgi:allene oxide cyclase-like protein